MDYDPNLTLCGRMAKQTVELTFQRWRYKRTLQVVVGGNCVGLAVISRAVLSAFDETSGQITLVAENGDELVCSDDEECEEEWLAEMLVGAQIVSIEPRVMEATNG